MIVRIPECCAMPHIGRPGDVYDCPTCDTRYRYLGASHLTYAHKPGEHWWTSEGWTLDGPLIQHAEELWPSDHVLAEDERR